MAPSRTSTREDRAPSRVRRRSSRAALSLRSMEIANYLHFNWVWQIQKITRAERSARAVERYRLRSEPALPYRGKPFGLLLPARGRFADGTQLLLCLCCQSLALLSLLTNALPSPWRVLLHLSSVPLLG